MTHAPNAAMNVHSLHIMSVGNGTRSAKKSVRSNRNEEAAPENRSGVDAKIQASQRIAPKTTKLTSTAASVLRLFQATSPATSVPIK